MKNSCEICLYTPRNVFFINSPQYSRENNYLFWDLGFYDIKSFIFYELGLLVNNLLDKNDFFSEWLYFLQTILDKQLFTTLFETFQFNKGMLFQSDRLMYEPAFIRAVKMIPENSALSVDFLIYLCDLMKNCNKMVSFFIFKKKLVSNLKNF